jgi:hypothetical protein
MNVDIVRIVVDPIIVPITGRIELVLSVAGKTKQEERVEGVSVSVLELTPIAAENGLSLTCRAENTRHAHYADFRIRIGSGFNQARGSVSGSRCTSGDYFRMRMRKTSF